MCGLFGILGHHPPINSNQREKYFSLLHHRGPDSRAYIDNENYFFLHTRLNIIDNNPQSSQPFISSSKNTILLFNGECYNYKTLKKDLQSKGYVFKTDSDTEVICEGFDYYGPSFIEKINGQFSLAYHDQANDTTYLIRDRVGIKNLYYQKTSKNIIFSNEMKPILHYSGKVNLDQNSIQQYFNFRYAFGDQTPFSNINKVSPGSMLICKGNNIIKKSYWKIPTDEIQGSELRINEQFAEILEDSIQLRTPLEKYSTFLSGGIDSSIITTISSRHKRPTAALTINFGNQDDEFQQASSLAKELSIKHISYLFKENDYNEIYSKALYHLEEPILDSIIAPTFSLFSKSKNYSNIVLLGEGADEIFGSYVHQRILYKLSSLPIGPRFKKEIGRLIPKLPMHLINYLFPYKGNISKSSIYKIKKILTGNTEYEISKTLMSMDNFPNDHSLNFKKSLKSHFHKQRHFDFLNWNPNYSLLRIDKLSMAHSIEARVPFLDHRLVEFAMQLPMKYLHRFYSDKVILRNFAKSNSSLRNISKRKKQALFFDISKNKNLLSSIKEVLHDPPCIQRGYVNQNLLKYINSKSLNDILLNKRIMSHYLFELWARNYFNFT